MSDQHPSRTTDVKSNTRICRFQDWREKTSTILGMLMTLCCDYIERGTTRLSAYVENALKEYNMNINAAKMAMTNTSKILEVLVDVGKLKQVDSFRYLGS